MVACRRGSSRSWEFSESKIPLPTCFDGSEVEFYLESDILKGVDDWFEGISFIEIVLSTFSESLKASFLLSEYCILGGQSEFVDHLRLELLKRFWLISILILN